MTISVPPYLRDPDPGPDPASEPQFTIHTRYGTEHHHQADEHRAGPSCPCGPRIQWLGRSE